MPNSHAALVRERLTLPATERLREIFRDEWEARKGQIPGLWLRDPSEKVPDRLPRVDAEAQRQHLEYRRGILSELRDLEQGQLTADDLVNLKVLRFQLETLVKSAEFRDYEAPVTSDNAFWIDLAAVGRRAFAQGGDHARWIAQMRDIPRFFAEQTEQMRQGLARGFTPPRITLEGRERALEGIATASPQDTPYFAPFRGRPADELTAEAVRAVSEAVQPAHARLLEFFRDTYVPGARQALACSDLPGGDVYYRAKIREYTTLDLTPEEIHQFGLDEVAQISDRMTETMRTTGFSGTLREFNDHLRSDPQFAARSGQELLMRAAWIAKRFDAVAGRYFGRLPRARMAIRPVPDEIAPFYTPGRATPGAFLLNLYEPESRALYNLPALTLHEGEPGHVFQLALAFEAENLPDFRRYVYLSAFGEGWALYAEELGTEMGIYETPHEYFGMLSGQMWRAARLVIDTGIHAFGWTRERALAYLGEHTALPEPEVVTEVDRYISWPGQALSYYLGRTTIIRAREKAERALGARFDLRAFHDVVMAGGSVPLPLLEARVDEFIGREEARNLRNLA